MRTIIVAVIKIDLLIIVWGVPAAESSHTAVIDAAVIARPPRAAKQAANRGHAIASLVV